MQPIDVISGLVVALLIVGVVFAIRRQQRRRATERAEYDANAERCRRERAAQETFDVNARVIPFSSEQRARALEIANRGRAS